MSKNQVSGRKKTSEFGACCLTHMVFFTVQVRRLPQNPALGIHGSIVPTWFGTTGASWHLHNCVEHIAFSEDMWIVVRPGATLVASERSVRSDGLQPTSNASERYYARSLRSSWAVCRFGVKQNRCFVFSPGAVIHEAGWPPVTTRGIGWPRLQTLSENHHGFQPRIS